MSYEPELPPRPVVPDQALAGYWQRLLGFGIDIFLLLGITVGAAVLTGLEGDEIREPATWPTSLRIGQFILVGLYYVILTGWRGETLGKMAAGTRVVGATTGVIPTWPAVTVRWAVVGIAGVLPIPFLSVLVYVFVLLDPRRRGLHDMAARTLVVDVRRYRVPEVIDE